MDRVLRGQAQSRQTAELQSAHPQKRSRLAHSSGRATGTMSGKELVDKLVGAGRDIFAETDLASDVQVDILDGIARIIEKKLSHFEVGDKLARPPAPADRPASTNAAADRKAETAGTGKKRLQETALTPEELAAMKLRERRDALEQHYGSRTPWAEARPKKPQEPTPADFQRWADSNFPDRRQLGLVLSDLRALDKEAYSKLRHWANPKGNAAKIDPARFGFPSKVVRYDPTKRVPTAAEVFKAFEDGDPGAPELRRDYMRARYHLQR